MKDKKFKSRFNPFLLFLLFAVVFVAGCIQVPAFLAQFAGTTQVMTKGLSVTDFSAMPAQQFAGRNVRLSMTLENTGGNTTGNILACITGENFPGESEQGFWQIQPSSDNICKRTRGLNPPDPNQQIPGGTTTVKWTVTAPAIPEGMITIDTFTTRLFYEYSTKASLSLTAIAEAERIAMAQRGESVQTFKVEKTEGPIEIDLDIAPQPVILIDSEAFANLKIILTNTGGGAVFDTTKMTNFFKDDKNMKTVAEDKMNRLILGLIYPKDKITIVCGEPQVSGKKDQYQIELFKEKYIVSCDISIKDSTLTTKKSYPIFVFANYGYYQDASVQVSVTSRPGMPIAITPGVTPTEERKLEYFEFDNYDALDICIDNNDDCLQDNEINLTFTETFNLRKSIKEILGRDEPNIFSLKVESDGDITREQYKNIPTKEIGFVLQRKSDYEYSIVNLDGRPTVADNILKPEKCFDKTNVESCEESEKTFDNPAYLDYYTVLGMGININNNIFLKKDTAGVIAENMAKGKPITAPDPYKKPKLTLKIFNPVFKQGEKIDIPIKFSFGAEKKEDGKTISVNDTRTMTLHLREKEYSQDFSLRKDQTLEVKIAKDEPNYEGTCNVKNIKLEAQSGTCNPEVSIVCSGGFVNLDSYAGGGSKFSKFVTITTEVGQNKIGGEGTGGSEESNKYPEKCTGESIKLFIEPSGESCSPDSLGNCETEATCKSHDYKFRLSLDIPTC